MSHFDVVSTRWKSIIERRNANVATFNLTAVSSGIGNTHVRSSRASPPFLTLLGGQSQPLTWGHRSCGLNSICSDRISGLLIYDPGFECRNMQCLIPNTLTLTLWSLYKQRSVHVKSSLMLGFPLWVDGGRDRLNETMYRSITFCTLSLSEGCKKLCLHPSTTGPTLSR